MRPLLVYGVNYKIFPRGVLYLNILTSKFIPRVEETPPSSIVATLFFVAMTFYLFILETATNVYHIAVYVCIIAMCGDMLSRTA